MEEFDFSFEFGCFRLLLAILNLSSWKIFYFESQLPWIILSGLFNLKLFVYQWLLLLFGKLFWIWCKVPAGSK
jgi:hypothetical protein